jgi:hypothetical protein
MVPPRFDSWRTTAKPAALRTVKIARQREFSAAFLRLLNTRVEHTGQFGVGNKCEWDGMKMTSAKEHLTWTRDERLTLRSRAE